MYDISEKADAIPYVNKCRKRCPNSYTNNEICA